MRRIPGIVPGMRLLAVPCYYVINTRALRAHTLATHALHSTYHIYIILQLGHMLSTTFTYMYEASCAHEQKVHAINNILYSLYRDWKWYIWGGVPSCDVALVMEQFSIKHLHTGRYQAINPYTIMADKEMTFYTIFVNRYLRNAMVILKVDPP